MFHNQNKKQNRYNSRHHAFNPVFEPVNVAYSSYQYRCDVYNAATAKKAAPTRPNPMPIFVAPLVVPVGVETAPELEAVEAEEAELPEEAAEAVEEEEAAEEVEAAEAEEEAAAEVTAAPDPVDVS